MVTPFLLSALLFLPSPAEQVGGIGRLGAQDARTNLTCSDQSGSALAAFEDENLEEAVRSALSIGENVALTCALVSEVTSLIATEAGIESLNGIQSLTGLEDVDLWDNAISDVSQLVGLTSLTRLRLGKNAVTDVGALSGLTSLTVLQIRENEIADISALVGLTQLINLDISYNNISDISPLSGMTRLTTLRVYNNPITDIGAMRGMTNLVNSMCTTYRILRPFSPWSTTSGLGGAIASFSTARTSLARTCGRLRTMGSWLVDARSSFSCTGGGRCYSSQPKRPSRLYLSGGVERSGGQLGGRSRTKWQSDRVHLTSHCY
jgi:Leucine Rich repeats (2 copies)